MPMSRTAFQKYCLALRIETERHERKAAALRRLLAGRQARCSHKRTHYNMGTGNNDSWNECLDCGKEV